jgi:hypothetical protein
VNSCHRSHQDKKRMTEGRCLQKASELLPACSNQAMDDECQHFWKMIASELVNYNDMVWFVSQNEIMGIFFNANRGFYELCHHTHLHPNNPPQAHFQIGPSKMYPQSINPPPHNSLSSLHSPKPFSVTTKSAN